MQRFWPCTSQSQVFLNTNWATVPRLEASLSCHCCLKIFAKRQLFYLFCKVSHGRFPWSILSSMILSHSCYVFPRLLRVIFSGKTSPVLVKNALTRFYWMVKFDWHRTKYHKIGVQPKVSLTWWVSDIWYLRRAELEASSWWYHDKILSVWQAAPKSRSEYTTFDKSRKS